MNLKDVYDKIKEKNDKITEEKQQINFFKKIKYSIFNLKKYDDMVMEGVKNALKYLIMLIFILSSIISIFYAKMMDNQYKEAIKNFEQVIPVTEYKDGILNAQSKEKVEVDNIITRTYVGGKIIIDTNSPGQEVVDNYVTEFNTQIGYIMLKDKVVVVNLNNEARQEYSYPEFFEKYINADIKEFTNTSFIETMKSANIGIGAQYISLTISRFVAWIAVFLIYIIIFTIVYKILLKMFKVKVKFGEIFCACSYSYTLSAFMQLIVMALGINNVDMSNINIDNIIIIVGVIYSLIFVNRKHTQFKKKKVEVINNK